jgi:hypothetical protein
MTLQKQSLYQIREEHLAILQEIEDNEGLLTPEIEAALNLTIDQFQDKALSFAFIIKTFDDSSSIIEAEIKRLKALQDKAEKRKELFKQRLSEAMIFFGVEKIDSPLLKLSFRKSEAVEILDEEEIPDAFIDVKEVVTISKARIKEALKKGEVVPGAELITKNNLQIK